MRKIGEKNKKAQVTIFIIIAIVIVVLGILIYMFYPRISSLIGIAEKSPSQYIQDCLEEDVEVAVDALSLQGGSINPEHYIIYKNDKIEYLCYTNEYYKTCVMQEPMLQQHIEDEIKEEVKDKVKVCFDDLENTYEKKGYSVNLQRGETEVELLPDKIEVGFDNSLSLTKSANTENYDSMKVVLNNNNLYELVSIANNILNWEAHYGDAETTIYMNYYRNIKVEKKKQSEGSTIYILTNRDTLNKFQFASRSLAWPPGYNADGVVA